MIQWENRPEEIANLLNPHFCGELLRRCIKKYISQKEVNFPYALSYLVLPIILHRLTRSVISSSRIQLHAILQRHQDLKVGFADRAKRLIPFTHEALIFLMQTQAVSINETAGVKVSGRKVRNKSDIIEEEIIDCFKTSETIGTLFARAGTVENVYYIWGVKP